MSLLQNITPLTQEKRLESFNRAKQAVIQSIGDKPSIIQFENQHSGKFPSYVTRSIITLCLLALVAAFIPSAIRLYHIGSETFNHSINHLISSQIVGLSVVIMAELSQLVFSLSLAVLGTSKASRRLLYFSMFVATSIALIGNVQVALPGHWNNPFAWLEAIAPPVLVLSLAYIVKEQMLVTIQHRYETQRTYQEAMQQWELEAANPDHHPYWIQFYANALKDELIAANKRKRTIDLYTLTVSDWTKLVRREMNADQWYNTEIQIEEINRNDNNHQPPAVLQSQAEVETETIPLERKNGHKAILSN